MDDEDITTVAKAATLEHVPCLRALEPAGDWFERACDAAYPTFRGIVEQLSDALVAS